MPVTSTSVVESLDEACTTLAGYLVSEPYTAGHRYAIFFVTCAEQGTPCRRDRNRARATKRMVPEDEASAQVELNVKSFETFKGVQGFRQFVDELNGEELRIHGVAPFRGKLRGMAAAGQRPGRLRVQNFAFPYTKLYHTVNYVFTQWRGDEMHFNIDRFFEGLQEEALTRQEACQAIYSEIEKAENQKIAFLDQATENPEFYRFLSGQINSYILYLEALRKRVSPQDKEAPSGQEYDGSKAEAYHIMKLLMQLDGSA